MRVRVPLPVPPHSEVVTSQGQPWHKQSSTITPKGVNLLKKTIAVTDFSDTFVPMSTEASLDYPEMQLPLFHLNGNTPERLGKQYFEALKAVQDLENKFSNIEFHSRDYYPLGEEAWLKARTQWEIQRDNIHSLRKHLEVHASHCFESSRELC